MNMPTDKIIKMRFNTFLQLVVYRLYFIVLRQIESFVQFIEL